MRNVSVTRHSRRLLLCRQIFFLTVISHFYFMTDLALHASASSLVQPQRRMVAPSHSELTACRAQAAEYGSGAGRGDRIHYCPTVILRSSSPLTRKTSYDSLVAAFAHANLLFFRKAKADGSGFTEHVITGHETKLGQIAALSIDHLNHEFVVLDDSQPDQILVYPLDEGGNLSPVRMIESPLVSGVRDIAVDPHGNRVFGAHPERASIVVFNRLADNAHPELEKRIAVHAEISGPLTQLSRPAAVTFDLDSNEIYVVDADRKAILVFDAGASGNVAPKRMIQSESVPISDGKHLSAVGYEKSSGMIEVLSYDGNNPVLLRFPRESSGRVAPVPAGSVNDAEAA